MVLKVTKSKSSVLLLRTTTVAVIALLVFLGGLTETTCLEAQAKRSKDEESSPQLKAYESLLKAGDEQMRKKQYAEAVKTYRELCWKHPQDPDAMLREAQALNKVGDLDGALDWGRKAVQYAPRNVEGHIQFARLQEANRNWKVAFLQYELATELLEDKNARVALEAPMLRTLLNLQEYEKADQFSVLMIKQNKKNPDCYYNRAYFLAQSPKSSDAKEAIACYEEVLFLDPKRSAVHFNLALLYEKDGDKAKACEQLNKFIKELPDDPDVKSAQDLLIKLKQ